jgi:hypothetical protein
MQVTAKARQPPTKAVFFEEEAVRNLGVRRINQSL